MTLLTHNPPLLFNTNSVYLNEELSENIPFFTLDNVVSSNSK